jgi:triosephosphate isomerase
MKKIFFGTNLKMYKNIQDTKEYLIQLQKKTKNIPRDQFELFVIPSYTSLPGAVDVTDQNLIALGAQNMCWEEQGQFTGEISPLMLKELELSLVMIGHSERRHVFEETDSMENKKVLCALNHGFTTLLCIGETGDQKEAGISDEVLRSQLKVGLKDLPAEQTDQLRIAYEPVWAIGVNGKPARTEYAAAKHLVIRQCLEELFGKEKAYGIPVLYGGSVNPQNAPELMQQENIDGLFVGRSAWNADAFNELIRDTISSLHR